MQKTSSLRNDRRTVIVCAECLGVREQPHERIGQAGRHDESTPKRKPMRWLPQHDWAISTLRTFFDFGGRAALGSFDIFGRTVAPS
jgi:hypothetical protein